MNKLIKLSNFMLCGIVLLILYFSNSWQAISTSLLSVVPDTTHKTLIKNFENQTKSKILFVASKGFSKTSLQHLNKIEKELLKIKHIQVLSVENNTALQQHLEEYQFFNLSISQKAIQNIDIEQKLQELYENLTTSFVPTIIDRNDPLSLLPKTTLNITLKNGHPILKDYGYIRYFQLNSSNLEEHTTVYNQLQQVVQNRNDIKFFSPIFYYVENAKIIKKDVNKIILLAVGILLLLYFILLRNIKLFVYTIVSLISSSAIALLVLSSIYSDISIFVIVFGVSISSIAIDYMFHHYMHHYYSKKMPYNKEVFYGFITTFLAFGILSLSSFILIKQIALFTMVSLGVSYIQFAWMYPKIEFKQSKKTIFSLQRFHIQPILIFLLSGGVIILSLWHIQFDLDIQNLDYDNQSLKKTEHFFKKGLSHQNEVPVLIEASSIDQLIQYAKQVKSMSNTTSNSLAQLIDRQTYNQFDKEFFEQLHKNINQIAEQVGFREGYFQNSYKVMPAKQPMYDLKQLETYDIHIEKYGSHYYYLTSVLKNDLHRIIESLPFVKVFSLKSLFESSIKNSLNELFMLGVSILALILGMLLTITKKHIIPAMNFLIFPFAMMLGASFFMVFNILHLFMVIIILAIGIDYAFYTSKQITKETNSAIIYSLLSTFAGFGVLIFSSINALFSMGIIASIGVFSILILLIFSKRFTNAT